MSAGGDGSGPAGESRDARPAWRRKYGPHLRAAFVAFHVLAMAAFALPGATRLNKRSAWRVPNTRHDVAQWAGRLRGLGVDTDAERLEEDLYRANRRWTRTRAWIHAPFRPYYDLGGVRQGWAMFSSPMRYPGWLHVDVDRGQGWETIYVSRSETETWSRGRFDNNRVRKLVGRFSRRKDTKMFRQLAEWVAREVAREDERVQRVRLRLHRMRSRSPADVIAGVPLKGKDAYTREVSVEAVR